MKKLSIILSLIILLFCTTAFVACGEESVSGNESATSVSESVGQEDENAGKPTYSGTNKLRIGMWSGVPTEVDGKKLTDEELLGYYRDLAASGITIASSAILYNSKEYNLRVLAAAEEVGIKQLIQDNDVTSVLFDVNVSRCRRIISALNLSRGILSPTNPREIISRRSARVVKF